MICDNCGWRSDLAGLARCHDGDGEESCPACGEDFPVSGRVWRAKCRSLHDEIAKLKEELEAIDHHLGDGYIAAGQRKRIQIVGNYRNPKRILQA